MALSCRNLWARGVSELHPHHIRGFCHIPCWAWPLLRPHVLPPSKLLMPGAASSDFWHQPSWFISTLLLPSLKFLSISFSPQVLQLKPHSRFHFLSASCVPPQRSGLQLKLIQAWGGSDDFFRKTAFFLHFGCNPRCYPFFCFHSYTTKGKGQKAKLLSFAFPLDWNTMCFSCQ